MKKISIPNERQRDKLDLLGKIKLVLEWSDSKNETVETDLFVLHVMTSSSSSLPLLITTTIRVY